MSLKKLLALITLPFVVLFVVAGCAFPAAVDKDDKSDTDSSKEDDSEKEDEKDDDASGDAPAGEAAAPGTRVGINEWLTHTFISTDDVEALVSARLVSVEKVTASQLAELNAIFDKDELKGYEVYMLLVEEKKVSGGTIEFNADYSYFDAVDSDGEKVQELTVIGWDACDSPSFSPEFDTEGTVITQCFLAAAPSGGRAPAGVAYTGGYEEGNPYSMYDGKPLYFIKG